MKGRYALCALLKAQGVKDAKPVHYVRKCHASLAAADHGIFARNPLTYFLRALQSRASSA